MRRILIVAFIMITTILWAQAPSRVQGKVTNSEGEPIPDVKISVTDQKIESNAKILTTDKKGYYSIAVTDGTHTYLFLLEKEGYVSWQEVIKPTIFDTLEKNFVLKTQEEANEMQRQKMLEDKPHLGKYEEGRLLLLDNKLAEAEAKFKEALALEPTYHLAHLALANIYYQQGDCDKAEKEARITLEADEESASAYVLLIGCATKRGDKETALAYQKILDTLQPDSPESLYNAAANLINQQNDEEAAKKLEEAVSIDPEFAKAYFELGFCYMRLGDMAKAKEYLQKYIEKAPDGDRVNDAKEAIKWL
ncbi:MAG TPA: tetratricopeptide repeat protein [Thermoanaerobaculia bacterium]|nr:tetratricopeptide repeat protein [Thermoanaerobaculia bacterium]HUM28888.1 tetratricopeptide repeat protein [Thermoanaerobaculia bacterium]HXK67179.1 tetratricopeptide repeat protein [Thermoanaerobaculia bacterium]